MKAESVARVSLSKIEIKENGIPVRKQKHKEFRSNPIANDLLYVPLGLEPIQ